MKQLYFLMMVCLCLPFLNAQIIDFPDTNFKTKLLQSSEGSPIARDIQGHNMAIDSNSDGEISIAEASLVYSIEINAMNAPQENYISNLTGINSFVNLRKFSLRNHSIEYADLNLSDLRDLSIISGDLVNINLNCPLIEKLSFAHNELFEREDYSQFVNLRILDLGYTGITSLQAPDNQFLNFISIASTNISTQDALVIPNPLSVTTLVLSQTNFPDYDLSSFLNLIKLYMSNNGITSFAPNVFDQLEILDLSGNQLYSIDVSDNLNLFSLDIGFNNIQTIDLSNNPNLFSLDVQSNNLTELDVSNNVDLTYINSDRNSLESMDISNNLALQVLNLQFNNLVELDCSSNPILVDINLTGCNELDFLNIKNGYSYEIGMELGNMSNVFNDISYICVDENYEVLNLFHNRLEQYNNTTGEVNTYCSFQPGGQFYQLEGQVSFDLDNNGCTQNAIDVPNARFDINNSSIYGTFYSNHLGSYNFSVLEGQHQLDVVLENPAYFTANPTSFTANFPVDESPFIQDICIAANGEHDEIEIFIVPLNDARPGFDAEYKIVYRNVGNQIIDFGQIKLTNDFDLMEEVSFNPTWNSFGHTSQTWSFNFEDLLPFESREIYFTFELNTPTDSENPLNNGDILTFNTQIFAEYDSENPMDEFTLNQTVVNSFDPNDKTCLEGDSVAPEMIGDYVHYMIRFENTGSAEAINVVVKDVINPEMFDIESLQPLDASHDFVTRIKNENEVEFIFENILLPFDDANNDGYVTFKIKTLNTLEAGNTFENNAQIYFDFNYPIITNTAITNIETLSTEKVDIKDEQVHLYPNPVVSVLNIKTESIIKAVQIFDMNGKLVTKASFIGNLNQIEMNVEKLPKGAYLVQITSENGILNEKILKK